MDQNNIKDKARKIKTYKMRKRILSRFFVIVSLGILITTFIVYLFEKHGMYLPNIKNHSLGIFGICIFCMIFSHFGYYIAIDQIFGPLEQISKAAKKVAKGDYTVQLDYKGNIEEFESTIRNFNSMVRELNSVEMIRNDFIANVSHEFKTPLASVTGYVTLLQDSDLTEAEREEYVKKIFFNIEKLNDLTENILRLSKLENQNCLAAPVHYRLDEQIREAIVLLEPKWSQKQINLDIDLEKIHYTGQQALLFQVWVNLIGNAIKFSDIKSEISIKLEKDQQKIKVLVSDTGIGMSPETQAHIFDKFYQGDTSRRSQGNGLGLALCKEILDKCKGKIYVTSEVGNGSVFMVVLDVEEG